MTGRSGLLSGTLNFRHREGQGDADGEAETLQELLHQVLLLSSLVQN
jgi:hypothetical protein